MPRRAKPLTAARVKTAPPGRYGDGEATGLYLLVSRKYFVFRYIREGKMREAGIGPAAGPSTITLVRAREKARALYDIVRDGRDPLEERDAARARQAAEEAKAATSAITFGDVAGRYLRAHEASWKNPKHRQQWGNTLRDYVLPVIGDFPVASVDTGAVMQIVEPLWRSKPETAARVRGRIEAILDYAKAREWRHGENPARWRGHLDHLLPARSKVARVEHHPALPWRDIGSFMAALRQQGGVAARALEFGILTAVRSGEVRGATWREIDRRDGLWMVPGARMKAGRDHRIPLSKAAMALLDQMAELRTDDAPDAFVFPGGNRGRPLSDVSVAKAVRAASKIGITVHGFRSTFRDWCAEATNYPRELAEKALAHTLSDKVEAAYQRGDMFEKRRLLMEDWSEFCSRPPPAPGEAISDVQG